MVRLRDLGNWAGGNTPSKANPAYWTEGTVPWVSPKDMKVHEITSSEDRITELALADGRVSLVPEGSVLFVTRSGILSHTFPVAITKLPVTINQDLKALTPKEGVSPKYVAHAIRGASQRILRECAKSGTTVASIETSRLLDFEIPIGGMREQLEIVAELEKQFSRLDEAVANLQRVKANLKRYKASVLKDAVEGRLVPTEAELARREGRAFETGEQLLQRILAERRAKWVGKGKFKEPLPIASEGIGLTPEGWGWATVEMICESIVDCPHSTAKFHANGFPCVDTTWMTTEGLVLERARYVDETTYLDRISRLTPRPGDIVFAREGTIGTAVLIPERMTPCLGQRVMLLRASKEYLNGLLVHVLHSEIVKSQYRAQALGSTVAHINVGDVKRFAVPVPPAAEQVRILAEVDRHLSIVREVEAEVDANLQRALALRQSVLARSFQQQ